MVLRDGTGDLLCPAVPQFFSLEEGWYRLICILKTGELIPYVLYLSTNYIPLPPPPPALCPSFSQRIVATTAGLLIMKAMTAQPPETQGLYSEVSI